MDGQLVLVTGASGFIAGHIIKQLLESGYNVRGTVRNMQSSQTKYEYLFNLVPMSGKNTFELIECDLTKPNNWTHAVKDCCYVIHTASPVISSAKPTAVVDRNDFTKPALTGMRYVLDACLTQKTIIKRFIYTSSRTTMIDYKALADQSRKLFISQSSQFTDIKDNINDYTKSKVLSEQFARDWQKQNNFPFEMCFINPSKVIGPLLTNRSPSSMTYISRLLNGKPPIVPKLNILFADVRDVAMAHVNALKAPNVDGKRYLVANNQGLQWIDIANIMLEDAELKEYHCNIPKYEAPNWMVRLMAWKDEPIRVYVVPRLGKFQIGYNQPSVRDLKIVYRPINETITEGARSLMQCGLIQKPKRKLISKTTIIVLLAFACGCGYWLQHMTFSS
eukprot:910610_1